MNIILGVVLIAGAVVTTPPAPASPCGLFADFVEALKDGYGEHPVARGMTPLGYILVVLANPKTGTWTSVFVSPAGIACTSASGASWQMEQPMPGVPS